MSDYFLVTYSLAYSLFSPFVELVALNPEIGSSSKRGPHCAQVFWEMGCTLAEGLPLMVREDGARCVEVIASFPHRVLITHSIE